MESVILFVTVVPKIFREVGEGTLPWPTSSLAPSRFFKWEENKYFSPHAYCFIYKSDLLNPNFFEKKNYFILFFLQTYCFDEQSKFLILQFFLNKKFKRRLIYERKLK